MKAIPKNVIADVADTLDDQAEELLDGSLALAKQLSGALIESGNVFAVNSRDTAIRVVYYGADAPVSDYAAIQHESEGIGPLTAQKPGTRDGEAGPGWLSRPYENRVEQFTDEIGQTVVDSVRRTVLRA